MAYVLLTVLSLVPIWLARPLVDAARLHYQGVVTEGQFLDREKPRRRETSFTGTIGYRTADGTPVEAKVMLEAAYADAFIPGATATIRYLPSDTGTISVESMPLDTGKRTFEVLAMTGFVAVLWLGLRRYRSPSPEALRREIEQSGYLSRRKGNPLD